MDNQLPPLQGPLQLGWTGPLLALEDVPAYVDQKGHNNICCGAEQNEEEEGPMFLPIIVDSIPSSISSEDLEFMVSYKLDRIFLLDGKIN